jgi:hypothetical protein
MYSLFDRYAMSVPKLLYRNDRVESSHTPLYTAFQMKISVTPNAGCNAHRV